MDVCLRSRSTSSLDIAHPLYQLPANHDLQELLKIAFPYVLAATAILHSGYCSLNMIQNL